MFLAAFTSALQAYPQQVQTATPRSTPTTCPVPGPSIGRAMTANATCQRPTRSILTRYDFASFKARDQRNRTQPALGRRLLPSCGSAAGSDAAVDPRSGTPRPGQTCARWACGGCRGNNSPSPGRNPAVPAAGPLRCPRPARRALGAPGSTGGSAGPSQARFFDLTATKTVAQPLGSTRIERARNAPAAPDSCAGDGNSR
jgi:hypothetical protein